MSGDRGRYEILPPSAEGNPTGLFALLDTRGGELLADDEGTVLTFAIRSSADDWRHRLSCYEKAGYGRR